jgi:hypothetical protein
MFETSCVCKGSISSADGQAEDIKCQNAVIIWSSACCCLKQDQHCQDRLAGSRLKRRLQLQQNCNKTKT